MDPLHIASLGTIPAVIMTLIDLAVANNVTPSKPINYFAKLLLVSRRSVNSLVWALIFVAVFGLVGAGGIGMALDTALNLFQWDRVAMVLFAIFTVVIVAEIAVTYIRKAVI